MGHFFVFLPIMDKMCAEYIKTLKTLDFQIESQVISSVYLVSRMNEYFRDSSISPYIIFALDKAKLFNADAVYFRFFDDKRPPLAQMYIYDNIQNPKSDVDYAELHKAIWSSCEIPCFYVVDKTVVKIYDSREPITIHNNQISSTPINVIDLSLSNEVLKAYNAELLNNGSFWEIPTNKNHFLYNRVASERLISGLRKVRETLQQEGNLSYELIDKLLIICILIKYLEENGIDKESKQNLAHAFFEKATNYKTLSDIISHNKLSCLLEALSKHFNGGIFSLNQYWSRKLEEADISSLAIFFDADFRNNLFGWYEYSFEHIPVELISNFYEEFIPQKDSIFEEKSKKSTGAVYTPSFLVNLLIDESLPLSSAPDSSNENIKLIDPACGSGIFLVTAYKRLVQRWRWKNSKDGKIANTNPAILKNILSQNIFGIDVNQNSVNLSIFSLQLALCSMLTPRQIWVDFGHLDNLENRNIIHQDFFDYLVASNMSQDFDLVIGNPPFARKKLGGKSIKYYAELLKEKYPVKFKNTEEEFALLFLEKTTHLLKKHTGKLCLILPSGPLLYLDKSSTKYRKSLFATYKVSQIIDFTYLRRVLFSATVPTLAIFLQASSPEVDSSVLHIVARRTKSSREKAFFEFDHYDFHPVPFKFATEEPYIWKCNLVGGGLVYNLINKIKKQTPTVRDFYTTSNIVARESVLKQEFLEQNINTGTKESGQMSLFQEETISEKKSVDFPNIGIWAIRKKITKGFFPDEVALSDFRKKKFDGISYKGNIDTLQQLKNYYIGNSDTICFYIASTSSRQGLRSPYVIYSSDIDSFPYIKNWDNILTVNDRILIKDITEYTLDEFGNGENAIINRNLASKNNLIDFSTLYCNILNAIYKTNTQRYSLSSITDGNAYYICEYTFAENIAKQPKIIKDNTNLENLLESWDYEKSRKINRILRVYTPNTIRLIKPKQLRYWLKSKALIDADDTFQDIMF